MHTPKLAVLALAAGAFAAAGVAQASAPTAPAKGVPDAAPAAAPAAGKAVEAISPSLAGRAPRGYVLIANGPLNDPTGFQVHGSATCPVGTVPFGGGAFITSGSTAANVNSSYPTGAGWAADVNNNSGAATTFYVDVLCGLQPRKYTQVVGPLLAINANSQLTNVLATCPSTTAPPLGGGAFSDSVSLFANINTSIPAGSSWRTDDNNGTGGITHAESLTVCGKLRGYHIAFSPATVNAAGTQTGASAFCGTGVPVGGGAFSSSGSTLVNQNASTPITGGWRTYMNNASGGSETFTTYVVCAGT